MLCGVLSLHGVPPSQKLGTKIRKPQTQLRNYDPQVGRIDYHCHHHCHWLRGSPLQLVRVGQDEYWQGGESESWNELFINLIQSSLFLWGSHQKQFQKHFLVYIYFTFYLWLFRICWRVSIKVIKALFLPMLTTTTQTCDIKVLRRRISQNID